MASSKHESVADTLVKPVDVPALVMDASNVEKQAVTSEMPDGGFTAWSTVAGAWLVLFCSFGYINAFGVFEDYYTRTYMTNMSSSDIAWIGSTQSCLQFFVGFFTGKLFDAGYFYSIIGVGSILSVFSLFMLSLAKENQYYQVFLPQAIGLGVSYGLLFLPAIGIISHHFARRRSLAMGIVLTGSSCGGIVFPIMLNQVFQRRGFGWGVRSTAFVVLGCLVVAGSLMRTRLPPKSKQASSATLKIKEIMTDSAYLFAVVGAFLILLGIFLPIFFIQLFSVVHGLDRTLAFYSLAIMNAASVFGRTIPNFLADKFGPFNLWIPSSIVMGVLMFAMFGITSSSALIAFSILYGFFSGAYVSLISPAIAGLATDVSEIGVRLGIAFTILGVASLVGSPISGALLSSHMTWWRPIVFSGVMVLAGSVALIAARSIQVKRKGHPLV